MHGKAVGRKTAAAQLLCGCLCDMYGDRMLFQQDGEGFGVVGVLVRDENGVDVRQTLADGTQRALNRTAAHARIDQNARITDPQKRAVALGAGKKRNDSVNGCLTHVVPFMETGLPRVGNPIGLLFDDVADEVLEDVFVGGVSDALLEELGLAVCLGMQVIFGNVSISNVL